MKKLVPLKVVNIPFSLVWALGTVIMISGFLGSLEWHQEQIRNWPETLPLRLLALLTLAFIGTLIAWLVNKLVSMFGFIDRADIKQAALACGAITLAIGILALSRYYLFGP